MGEGGGLLENPWLRMNPKGMGAKGRLQSWQVGKESEGLDPGVMLRNLRFTLKAVGQPRKEHSSEHGADGSAFQKEHPGSCKGPQR